MKELDISILKVPPQNLEAEQSILGGILLENVAINPGSGAHGGLRFLQ